MDALSLTKEAACNLPRSTQPASARPSNSTGRNSCCSRNQDKPKGRPCTHEKSYTADSGLEHIKTLFTRDHGASLQPCPSPHLPFPSKASMCKPARPSPQHPLATAPTCLTLSHGPQQRRPPGPPPTPISPTCPPDGMMNFLHVGLTRPLFSLKPGIKPRLHKAASRL